MFINNKAVKDPKYKDDGLPILSSAGDLNFDEDNDYDKN